MKHIKFEFLIDIIQILNNMNEQDFIQNTINNDINRIMRKDKGLVPNDCELKTNAVKHAFVNCYRFIGLLTEEAKKKFNINLEILYNVQ